MKQLLLLLFFSTSLYAQEFYIFPSALFTYSSSSSDEYSSMIGTGVSLGGGLRFGPSSFEMEFKRYNVSNNSIGNDKYDTRVFDSIFSGGVRLILQNIFSFKFGLANHAIETEVEKNGNRQRELEENGNFFSLYGGMGVQHNINKEFEVFLESTLYPVSDVDMFFVDFQLGVRFYL